MKKIGIITHYYKNVNFGGNLQAYALCQFLNNNNFKSEQISLPLIEPKLNQNQPKSRLAKFKSKGILGSIKSLNGRIKNLFSGRKKEKRYTREYDLKERRAKAIGYFNDKLIPHSNKVYSSINIQECINDYDIFITGSDQVWNMNWYKSAFFLDFVPSNKTKLSYAASLGKSVLSPTQKDIFRNSLADFKAISIREKNALEVIKDLTAVEPQYVCDPVLLLEQKDWDQVCSDRIIEEKYLFCYFLGRNQIERTIAEQYAKEKGLKIVSVPYADGYNLVVKDLNYGNIRLFDMTPQEFISLIKHAEYVFTDSFHAVVFSFIYQKQYFVFNRDKKASMSSRIIDITNLFGTAERFCAGKERENLQYVLSLEEIDYSKEHKEFENLKKDSIEFLKKNLG